MQLLCFLLLAAFINAVPARGAENDALRAGFESPPVSAAPMTWWHWVNGNITREGITADLESMKRVGLGGATVVNISFAPPGPVKFMSDDWRALLQHAVRESARLGLALGVENCAGWSSSGGPWITPDRAMQTVTFSEIRIPGGAAFSGNVPQPESRLGFYRDIATLAFPTLEAALVEMKDAHRKITSDDANLDSAKLVTGDATLDAKQPHFIEFEFTEPYPVRTLALRCARNVKGELQSSDDGAHFRKLREFNFDVEHAFPQIAPQLFAVAAPPARFYRVSFGPGGAAEGAGRLAIKQLDLRSVAGIDGIMEKADFRSINPGPESDEPVPPGNAIDPAAVIDLTGKLDSTGKLTWTAPAGNWTVMRFGYTPTGVKNHPAPPEGEGLECDKLSRAAVKFHWDQMMAKIIADSGPLAGKTLNHTLIDSYEVHGQNWTAGLETEFERRQGYSLIARLPALAGWIVGSRDESERLLWDFRRTVADLFDENYFDYMGELARGAGLALLTEPYGDGPFDDLAGGRGADMPMTEFWTSGPSEISTLKDIASISHVYGKPLTAAEAFTGSARNARWQMSPASLKAVGDLAFASGVNQLFFHRFAHQPWLDRVPGMTAGQFGAMLDRTNTWWEQSGAWIKYLARCQWMLRQGRFVGDALFLAPEGSPRAGLRPQAPAGYDWDCCNADAVLHRLNVRDGRLALPDGTSYSALVLPDESRMTPELLGKIAELAAAGATIVGPPPSKSPSLRGYPQCDEKVRAMASGLRADWAASDHSLAAVFAAAKLPPDFESPLALMSLHRQAGDREIYFVSNQSARYQEGDCIFRVAGKTPEFWRPETGKVEAVAIYAEENGRTRVHLRLGPTESVFVVFKPSDGVDHAVALIKSESTALPEPPLKIVHAAYRSAANHDAVIDVTAALGAMMKSGALSVRANRATFGDPAPGVVKELAVDYQIDGEAGSVTIPEGALLDLPGSTKKAVFGDAAIAQDESGAILLQAWQRGRFKVSFASGKSTAAEIADLPAPLVIGGPWNVSFQPNRGAPARAMLETLQSWSANPDPGVKYFSGTGVYVKGFDAPASLLGEGRRLFLDLGDVQVIAALKVNGKDFGVLWKPPFGVDVTDVIRAGRNDLEVKVTNLWVNRLIGDEQLPSDCRWKADGGLAEWPAWLTQGRASPSGRITFTTWHHWKKEDALKPSGLLGPVRLISSTIQKLSPDL